jgi:hypothetical protein
MKVQAKRIDGQQTTMKRIAEEGPTTRKDLDQALPCIRRDEWDHVVTVIG